MTIPTLPSLDRTSPTFRTDLDTFFLTQLPNTVTALNSELTRIDGITAAGFTGTSTTSLAITGSGSITLTTQANKGFAPGQFVAVSATADPAEQMSGTVTAYDVTTGVLSVSVSQSAGTGTYAAWTVAISAAAASPYSTGDIVLTARTLTAPTWLPADGSIYSQSSYAALYAEIGLLANAPLASKLANPATLPPTGALSGDWDPSGTYLAVSAQASPWVVVYKRTGDTLTKLADPDTIPSAQGHCQWDSTGTYLACTNANTAPRILVYKRTGDALTKLTNPASLPTSTVGDLRWSGDYLAVWQTTSPFVLFYQRTGDTLKKLADPATLPTSYPTTGLQWQGTHLALGLGTTSPYLEVFSVSGTTVSRLPNPAALPYPNGVRHFKWSPSGGHAFIVHQNSSVYYYGIYSRVGTTLTQVAVGAFPSAADQINDVTWHPSGKYIVCTRAGTPFMTTFSFDGGSGVMVMPNPSTLLSAMGLACEFNPAGTHLTVSQNASPWLVSYAFSRGAFTYLGGPSSTPGAGVGAGGIWHMSNNLYTSVVSTVSPFIYTYKNTSYDTATQFVVPDVPVSGTTPYIKA